MGRKSSCVRNSLEEHFLFVPTENCYRCKLCPKLMKGVKKVNFVQSARDHLSRLHPQILNDNVYQLVQQLRLSTTGQAASSHFKKRERLVKALAKTRGGGRGGVGVGVIPESHMPSE